MGRVLDHGYLELEAHEGGDLSVVNGARISYDTQKTSLDDRDKGLIRYLMRERHGTPFEHNHFRFRIHCPLFVAREWMRHRIGSYNEVSMRYVQVDPVYYVPGPEEVRTRVGKPGHYTFQPVDPMIAQAFIEDLVEFNEQGKNRYESFLELGVAPEIARLFISVATYTEFMWSVNARSLMNFLSLRNSATAQKEIRLYAEAAELEFLRVMPLTAEAFMEFERKAP